MSGTSDNARVWTDGSVAVGEDLDVVLPDDIVTALAAGFHDLGLLTEDGFTDTTSYGTNDDKFAYGGQLVRQVRGKYKQTFKFAAMENNGLVYQLRNPGSTSETAGGLTTNTVKVPTKTSLFLPFVITLQDGDINRRRIIPKGQVFRDGDGTISDAEIELFGFEVVVIPDDQGVLYIDITDDPGAEVTVVLG